MNKLMTMVFAMVMGFSLSMPAFAKAASGQKKVAAHKVSAKKKGALEGKKEGQEGVSPASAKSKTEAHEMHARKKGATVGKKTGQEGTLAEEKKETKQEEMKEHSKAHQQATHKKVTKMAMKGKKS